MTRPAFVVALFLLAGCNQTDNPYCKYTDRGLDEARDYAACMRVKNCQLNGEQYALLMRMQRECPAEFL